MNDARRTNPHGRGGRQGHASRRGPLRNALPRLESAPSGGGLPRDAQEAPTHFWSRPLPGTRHVRQLGVLALRTRQSYRGRGDRARGLRFANPSARRIARADADLSVQPGSLALDVRPEYGGRAVPPPDDGSTGLCACSVRLMSRRCVCFYVLRTSSLTSSLGVCVIGTHLLINQ